MYVYVCKLNSEHFQVEQHVWKSLWVRMYVYHSSFSTSNRMWEFFFSLHPHARSPLSSLDSSFAAHSLFANLNIESKFVIATRLQLNIIYDPIFQVRQASLGKWIKAIWKVFSPFVVVRSVYVWMSVCVRVCCCRHRCCCRCWFFSSSLDAKHQPRETLMVGWLVGWIGWSFWLFYVHCTLFRCQTTHQ